MTGRLSLKVKDALKLVQGKIFPVFHSVVVLIFNRYQATESAAAQVLQPCNILIFLCLSDYDISVLVCEK